MADAGFFKGTSADQDGRFSDKELKLLRSMKFPPEFDKKVDMRKVNLTVIRPWITKKVVQLVGFEDEVVVEYAMGLLEDKNQPTPDPKKMQINLTGFLTKDTPTFMTELWKLLLEAQDSAAGIPQTFVEEKKEEMRKAKEGDSRAINERDRRVRLDEIRDNERNGRGGGRGRSRGRGRGRGGYDGDSRPRDGGWGGRGGGPGEGGRRRMSRSSRRRSISSTPPRGSRTPPGRRYRSPPRRRSESRDIHSSRSPPQRRRSPVRSTSRSPSRSPPRRRRRLPSYSPPRDRLRRRDSRSPPPQRRRHSVSRSPSRSVSPPPIRSRKRRSASPPRRRNRSISGMRSRSPRRSPPRRGGNNRRDQGGRSRQSSRSRSDSRSPRNRRESSSPRMDVDFPPREAELKIKGRAEAERQKSKWDGGDHSQGETILTDLERRESELKEKALRNKVLRTRKGTAT